MKKQFLLTFLLALALNMFSQSDSAAFVHGPWLSEKVDGLVLRRCQFKHESLFASNQQILVWELAPTADFTLRLAYRPERTKTSDMAQKQHAVAAVNGSFSTWTAITLCCFCASTVWIWVVPRLTKPDWHERITSLVRSPWKMTMSLS